MIRAIACIVTVMGANDICSSGPKAEGLTESAKDMLKNEYIRFAPFGKNRPLCEKQKYKLSEELRILWKEYKADYRKIKCVNGVYFFKNLEFGPKELQEPPCQLKESASVPNQSRPVSNLSRPVSNGRPGPNRRPVSNRRPKFCRKGSYRFWNSKNKLENMILNQEGLFCKHNGKPIKVQCQHRYDPRRQKGVFKMVVTDMQNLDVQCPTQQEAAAQAKLQVQVEEAKAETAPCRPFVPGYCETDKIDTELCPGECEN